MQGERALVGFIGDLWIRRTRFDIDASFKQLVF
jgi:hypothetical protein